MIRRPMLACSQTLTEADLKDLPYSEGVYVSEKQDGIRCLIVNLNRRLTAVSRKLIKIPNVHIQDWADVGGCFAGMDGELVVPGATFHETQSKIMTQVSLPFQFRYRVFDHWRTTWDMGYLQRLQLLHNKMDMFNPENTTILAVYRCVSARQVWARYQSALENGAEGLIIRTPRGPYKQGRSTMNEQYMLKLKLFEDHEAIIIDFEPEYENQNEQTKDNTGAAKRSKRKANLTPIARLGALVVRDCETKEEFRIGSGFDHSQKEKIWKHRDAYHGQIVTYKSQTHGRKDKPRTPIFKGVRLD